MTVIQTARLTLSHLTGDEAEFIFRLMNSPGWLKFIGDRGIRTLDDAGNYIRNNTIRSYSENGFGMYLVQTNADMVPIGVCGLVKRSFLEHADIGFAFLPEYSGYGYAYESASAVLKYAGDILGLKKLVAIVSPGNQNSIRLLGKLGMRRAKDIQWPGEELPLFQFSTVD